MRTTRPAARHTGGGGLGAGPEKNGRVAGESQDGAGASARFPPSACRRRHLPPAGPARFFLVEYPLASSQRAGAVDLARRSDRMAGVPRKTVGATHHHAVEEGLAHEAACSQRCIDIGPHAKDLLYI